MANYGRELAQGVKTVHTERWNTSFGDLGIWTCWDLKESRRSPSLNSVQDNTETNKQIPCILPVTFPKTVPSKPRCVLSDKMRRSLMV